MSKSRKNYKVKEDSTIGNSVVAYPKTFKGDVLVQVWVNSRILATLSEWLDRNGNDTRYMSEVVKKPLKILMDYLIEIGEVSMVEDTGEARAMLKRKYRVRLNSGNRGRKNEQHNMLLSSIMKEGKVTGLGRGIVNSKPNTLLGGVIKEGNKSNAQLAREQYERDEDDRLRADVKSRIAELPVDNRGMVIVEPHGHGDYTEKDKVKDDALKSEEDINLLLKRAKKIVEEGKKVKKKIKKGDDRIAKFSDEKFEDKERKRLEREKKEREAFNSIDINDLKPVG